MNYQVLESVITEVLRLSVVSGQNGCILVLTWPRVGCLYSGMDSVARELPREDPQRLREYFWPGGKDARAGTEDEEGPLMR